MHDLGQLMVTPFWSHLHLLGQPCAMAHLSAHCAVSLSGEHGTWPSLPVAAPPCWDPSSGAVVAELDELLNSTGFPGAAVGWWLALAHVAPMTGLEQAWTCS